MVNRRDFLRLSFLAGIAASVPAPVVKYILEPIANRIVGENFIVDFPTMTITSLSTDTPLDLSELVEFVRSLPGGYSLGKFHLRPRSTWVLASGWTMRMETVEALAAGGWGEDEDETLNTSGSET